MEYFGLLARGGGACGDATGGVIVDVGENWVKQTARNSCEIMTSNGVATLTVPVHGGSNFAGRVAGAGCVGGVSGGVFGDGSYGSGGIRGGGGGAKILTKDVRIDNSKNWQHRHWVSLVSAYRNSPYFDHYEESFARFYAKKVNFLTDFNLFLLNNLTSMLGLGENLKVSENYVVASPDDVDMRGKKSLRRVKNLLNYGPENPEFLDFEGAKGDRRENRTARGREPEIDRGRERDGDPGREQNQDRNRNFDRGRELNRDQNQNRNCDGDREPNQDRNRDLVDALEFPEYTQVFSDRFPFVPGLSIVDLLFCEGPAAREFLLLSGRG